MGTVGETIESAVAIIAALRAVQEATHKNTALRHHVWLGLWQRGYGLAEIATVSGHSRERVRMVLMRMHDGHLPERQPR